MRNRVLARVGRAALCALSLAPAVTARAAGVDGAGRVVVVPLVVTSEQRESLVTLVNTGSERVRVTGLYVGMEGTMRAASVMGPIACDPQEIPPEGSLAMELRDLCPNVRTTDGEQMGYLELESDADAHANFFATSAVNTKTSATFGVAGYPVGAFDTARLGVTDQFQVAGLRTRAGTDENLVCYVASLDEAKKVDMLLLDDTGNQLGSRATYSLDPRRMQRFDVVFDARLSRADRDNLSVTFRSGDAAQIVAGCGPVRPALNVLGYQPAQALNPSDRARLRQVNVFAGQQVGPLNLAVGWMHTLVGDAETNQVILNTYLRSDDQVRCRLIPWVGPTGLTRPSDQWTEIRMFDPNGVVIAGGNGAKDTGLVSTNPRGRYAPGTTQRYRIAISFDEDAHAAQPWPFGAGQGVWGVHCESGSGMSEPFFLFQKFPDTF